MNGKRVIKSVMSLASTSGNRAHPVTAAGTKKLPGERKWSRRSGGMAEINRGSGEERWEEVLPAGNTVCSNCAGLYSAYRPHFARELAHGCLMKY
ncbi:hypothetical protein EVAR_99298_1 [Eumeta japonica]|uniref:Uncharacterized protein n=1 Tax=Eumeta variegata TaxID=151549 RepID=A0A4C2A4W2_EUMVA|nr:hypothetical protein EVAR_99298_1 [Eumeta japonica]